MRCSRSAQRGFSLVELVVVIVIIAILAAMAIPRLSRGSAGASDSAVLGDLAILRNALNLYAAEHNNEFPPATDPNDLSEVLTQYSSAAHALATARDATHKYGPYLVAIPPCPVGNPSAPTKVLVDATNSPPTVDTTNGEGWIYNPGTGEIIPNTSATDATGTAYSDY